MRMLYKQRLRANYLTLVLLNPFIPCLFKQCRSRSVGFWRSQLIWICTVCHKVCEFIASIWINQSDWLKIRCGILIYTAWQGLKSNLYTHVVTQHADRPENQDNTELGNEAFCDQWCAHNKRKMIQWTLVTTTSFVLKAVAINEFTVVKNA